MLNVVEAMVQATEDGDELMDEIYGDVDPAERAQEARERRMAQVAAMGGETVAV